MRKQLWFMTAVLVWLAGTIVPAAGQQPAPGQFPVNTTVSGYQFSAAMGMNATGKFAIVWASDRPDSNEAVFLQRFNANGTPAGAEIRVDDPTFVPFSNNRKRDPAVAMDAAGNFLVVWAGGLFSSVIDQFNYTFSSSQIYGQRFDANGVPQGTNFLVNTNANASVTQQPSVAMYASGEAVIVWSGFGPADGHGTGIFGQRLDPNGLKLGPANCHDYLGTFAPCDFIVNSYTVGNQFNPKVAVNPEDCTVPSAPVVCTLGSFVVVWEGAGITDSAGIFGRLFDGSDGAPSGPQFQVTNQVSAKDNPAVGMDANLNVIVVWNGSDNLGVRGVFGQLFGFPSGSCPPGTVCGGTFGPSGPEFQVASLLGGSSHFNRLSVGMAPTSAGNFVVAWNDLESATSANDAIFAQRFDSTRTVVGTQILVSIGPATYYRPATRMSAAGNFVVAWEGGNDGSFFGIYARDFIAALDTTPPVITPNISGMLGTNNWYTSNVAVTWSVVDPETAVTSQVGCAPAPITSDSAGMTVTCSATSAGGPNSNSVTVKRDATPPNISITTPASGASYALNQPVPSSYNCTDNLSGVTTCAGPVNRGTNIDTQTTGMKSFTVNSNDAAGNLSSQSVSYEVVCHYVTLTPTPSTAPRSSTITANFVVSACASATQMVVVRFTLTGPLQPASCGSTNSVSFNTPSFTLTPKTLRNIPFPFRVPAGACLGTYSLTATLLVNGIAVDTSTATLTVTP